MTQRRDAIALTCALTYLFAVAGHAAVHLALGVETLSFVTPAHIVMAASSLAALIVAVRVLGFGVAAPEARRRAALLATAVRRDRTAFAAGMVGQAIIMSALLTAENATIAPGHLVEAIVCGLLAAACSAFAVSTLRARLPALAAALHGTPCARRASTLSFGRPHPFAMRRIAFARARPARAPPIR